MTNKEIRALIERRKKDWRYGNSVEAKYKAEECDDILELIDSMQEEPVSEDLDAEVEHYIRIGGYDGLDSEMEVKKIANHFANWQLNKIRKKYEKNRN